MGKHKDKIGKTRFGAFLSKASKVLPELVQVGTMVATGNISGAISKVSDVLTKEKGQGNTAINELAFEWEKEQHGFAIELYELEIKDRDSARDREVEMAKSGKTDWLMYAAGITALGVFILMVISVIFIPSTRDNPLFIHLMGIVEGVALTLFSYYFGTSKSSSDKNKLLKAK